MAQKRFTEEQIRRMRKIEDFRVAKGLPGYEDAIEALLTGLMEKDGLTEDDLASENTGESFGELLTACKFAHNRFFTEDQFPLEPVLPDEDEWEVAEYQFPKLIMIDRGLSQLQEMATKGEIRLLAGSRRALKWIAEHPNAQMDHPIILPITTPTFDNQMIIPLFDETGYSRQRTINFRLVGMAALQDFRWLVLRKKAEAVQVTNPVSEPPTQESFAELLVACRQTVVSEDFNEKNFPLEPVLLDEDDWVVAEHHFERVMTIEQGLFRLTEMAKNGEIRLLSGPRRALKWIADHRDEQNTRAIVLPLCTQNLGYDVVTPIFSHRFFEFDFEFYLNLHPTSTTEVFPVHSWLILRKRQNPIVK